MKRHTSSRRLAQRVFGALAAGQQPTEIVAAARQDAEPWSKGSVYRCLRELEDAGRVVRVGKRGAATWRLAGEHKVVTPR